MLGMLGVATAATRRSNVVETKNTVKLESWKKLKGDNYCTLSEVKENEDNDFRSLRASSMTPWDNNFVWTSQWS